MKKFVLALLFLLALSLPALAEGGVAVVIDGELFPAGEDAEILEGRVYLPLRAVAEELGAEVEWKPESRGITLTRDGRQTDLAIGSFSASVTEDDRVSAVMLEAAPYIKDERTFVPLRFIAQGLGCSVYWCEELKTAVITETHSRATGNLAEVLEPYLTIDIPEAIKADNATIAENIAENPESVMNYFANLWTDRALEVLAENMTEAEKEEYTALDEDFDGQWSFLEQTAEGHGIPLDTPVKMCAVTNNGLSAIIIDAPTVRTMDMAPICAFLNLDGSVVSVRL